MAETPASPEHDPAVAAPVDEPVTVVAAEEGPGDGPADLEAVLAAALDEDDLPEPHPPAPTPTLEAATARPTVGSYGAPDPPEVASPTSDSTAVASYVASYGNPEAQAEPAPPVAAASPAPAGAPGGVSSYGEPTVATTLEVAPRSGGQAGAQPGEEAAEGGEFDLLMGRIGAWFDQADLAGQWDRLSGPLRGLGLLLGGLLVMKLYFSLLDTLDDVPLLPRLLQLMGLIWLFNFSVTRLTRSSDRKEILEDWKRRWDAFRGS